MLTDKHCEICRKDIYETDRVILCPLCGCDFHADHIILWLRGYSSECPACKGEIKSLLLPECEDRTRLSKTSRRYPLASSPFIYESEVQRMRREERDRRWREREERKYKDKIRKHESSYIDTSMLVKRSRPVSPSVRPSLYDFLNKKFNENPNLTASFIAVFVAFCIFGVIILVGLHQYLGA